MPFERREWPPASESELSLDESPVALESSPFAIGRRPLRSRPEGEHRILP